LPRRQVLERGGEGELDALPLLVACVRTEQRGFESELGRRLAELRKRLGKD